MAVTQSTSYLQLLEYIKEKGVEQFQMFSGEIAKHSQKEWIDLTIRGKASLSDLMKNFPQVTEFYETYPQNDLGYSLADKKFANLVEYISQNKSNLDNYIESFKVISRLGVDYVEFIPGVTSVEVDAALSMTDGQVGAFKINFTDGHQYYQVDKINEFFESYRGHVSFDAGATFIVVSSRDEQGKPQIKITLPDLAVDKTQLPLPNVLETCTIDPDLDKYRQQRTFRKSAPKDPISIHGPRN